MIPQKYFKKLILERWNKTMGASLYHIHAKCLFIVTPKESIINIQSKSVNLNVCTRIINCRKLFWEKWFWTFFVTTCPGLPYLDWQPSKNRIRVIKFNKTWQQAPLPISKSWLRYWSHRWCGNVTPSNFKIAIFQKWWFLKKEVWG